MHTVESYRTSGSAETVVLEEHPQDQEQQPQPLLLLLTANAHNNGNRFQQQHESSTSDATSTVAPAHRDTSRQTKEDIRRHRNRSISVSVSERNRTRNPALSSQALPAPPLFEDYQTGRWSSTLRTLLGFAAGILATLAWSSITAAVPIQLASRSFGTLSSGRLSTRTLHSSSVSSLGRTVELGGQHYFVPGKPKTTFTVKSVPPAWLDSSLFPLTVVASSDKSFGEASFDKVTASYAEKDDVWTSAFMENVLLDYQGIDASACLDPSISTYSNSSFIASGYATRKASKMISISSTPSLPNGPYFASVNSGVVSVYEAWKLYPDTERAFFYGTIPHAQQEDSFQVLSASLPQVNGVAAIGVPSRLYYTKTDEKPLAGVRVAVKDLYDLAGLKTSMGSRAWLSLYPPATTTAPSIQRLIDLGAIIIGKTRLSQFANGQYGTADNVDYGVPFNSRGDGYQDPSSSSSGAGASSGSYGWLDVSVGSDTGGSVRAPGGVNGAFANRPSQGAIDLTGVLPLSPAMDSSAFLTTDAQQFAAFGKAYYGGNTTFKSYPSFPKKLLYMVDPDKSLNTPSPGFFPANNPTAAPIFEDFVSALEGFLGVERIVTDFYARFQARFGMLPADFIGPAWSLLTAYDQWTLVGKQFTEDYAAANDGDRPFVDPPVRKEWDYAINNLTETNRTFYLERKQEFVHFVSSEFMAMNSSASCSNALTVFPLTTGTPLYKSDYHLAGTIYNGWNRYSISQLGQVPEVVIPIGQVPYTSVITQTTKYLPVSISIQAAAGCDFVLYDLVAALADAGIIKNPTPGTSKAFAS